MNNPNICDLIQHSSLTSDLSEAQCSDLSSVAAARSLDDKEVLIEQGQIDETLHIVSSGALTVERVTAGGETVTLQHTAHSRDTFVRGALCAARWVINQKPGLYSMFHVLGL